MNGNSKSLLWDNGSIIPIGGLNPGGSADAQALNDLGQVVGGSYASPSGYYDSFLWEGGTITDLNETIDLGGAHDVNNLGQIAGVTGLGSSTQAAFWDGTKVVGLGTLGGQYAYATGINEVGQVVGGSERAPGGDREFFSFLSNEAGLIDVAAVTDRSSYEYHHSTLNNCGEIIVSGDFRAGIAFFRFRADGSLAPIRGASPPYGEWHDLFPRKMNDYGEIVGYGVIEGLPRAFLLAPIAGDINVDGYIDLRDFAVLQTQYTGSRSPGVPGCMRADIDRDVDVDLADHAMFIDLMKGP
jgi:probable HAF family extracellular repeat protein